MNLNNNLYIKIQKDIDFLKELEIKRTVFKHLSDLKEGVIDKMNSHHSDNKSFKYILHATDKYIVLKCGTCEKFECWFHNPN